VNQSKASNQTVILTTNGSNDPGNSKLDYSFDPYSTGSRK
jgi:hypothetical protein